MSQQKKRARDSGKFYQTNKHQDWVLVGKEQKTHFVGYDYDSESVNLIKYKKYSDRYEIVLDKTPFYAESGGQIGDKGIISGRNFTFEVLDTQKIGDHHGHFGVVKTGELKINTKVKAQIDEDFRQRIVPNHSATHLLHESLRNVLGDHVSQKGSLVNDRKLRFDFTYNKSLTNDQINEIEMLVNITIRSNLIQI